MSSIKVLKPGLCTTIQDIGRVGYQQFGIPVSGVVDEYAFVVANYLTGNDKNNAILEIPFMGPTLEFDCNTTIAITGANLDPKINNMPVTMWQSINVKSGDTLSFGTVKSGMRGYLAISAEIDVPVIMGSKSTLLKSKLGGYQGRQLKANDILGLKNVKVLEKENILDVKYIPEYSHNQNIRVVLGPQDDYFTDEAIKTLVANPYTVTKEADRMGMRLAGEVIQHKDKADIISDATVFGSIQVPGNGQPIILLADRQTTGGYTKIASVIKADLPKLAQMIPNDTIRFCIVSIEEAQQEYRKFYTNLEEIKKSFESNNKEKSGFFKKLFGK